MARDFALTKARRLALFLPMVEAQATVERVDVLAWNRVPSL